MGLKIYLDREGNGRSTRIWLDCYTLTNIYVYDNINT